MSSTMHWARWGDPARATALPAPARSLVELAFGALQEQPAVAPEDVVLPQPTLTAEILDVFASVVGRGHLLTDDRARLLHTRGKSTPDLLRVRAGDASDAPDAVAVPGDHDEVAALLEACARYAVAVVPYGGGTSVVGGLTARRDGFAGVVALDLARLDHLVALDEVSHTATLGAGLRGPAAEALLSARGWTLGHFPQSFEYATIGGFAATRSSGQSSAGYGRFDSMVVGLRVATAHGTLDLGAAPASAAGPDLRQVVLGSEGAFGAITAVTVRVRPLPDVKVYDSWRFPDFAQGVVALRHLAQSGLLPTVLRLSDEAETVVNLTSPESVGSAGGAGVAVLTGYEGTAEDVADRRAAVATRLRTLGGDLVGGEEGEAWARGRFGAPYLRDSLLDLGILVETLETATFWSGLEALHRSVRSALEADLVGQGTQPLVLCHVSHVYETGASLYFTVVAKELGDPVAQWVSAKRAASDAIVAAGATITHHHAVGRDHRPWLAAEVGDLGVAVLRSVKAALDPEGILNPGVLVP